MAVETRPLGQERVRKGPKITQETYDEMRRREYQATRNPDMQVPSAPLNRDEKYVFRTKPRTVRGLVHLLDLHPNIDGSLDPENVPKDRHLIHRWEKFFHKNDTPEHTALMRQVYEDLGGNKTIVFQPLHRKWECFYATNSEAVATYLRDLMQRGVGEFQWVYEQNPKSRVVVGEKAFPNTEQGMKMAQEHMRQIGASTLEVVDERAEE